ncbi:helix-turn-helix domain-containing protein [Desulfovibrio sp. OttesenSCG-928-A18]|nr:helix-turn-helix domain-containing protein [Desulfovibrio sp. OttesenSCG-928-A18]
MKEVTKTMPEYIRAGYMTITEAAALLGYATPRTLQLWCNAGREEVADCVKVGKTWLLSPADIKRLQAKPAKRRNEPRKID